MVLKNTSPQQRYLDRLLNSLWQIQEQFDEGAGIAVCVPIFEA